MEGFLPVALLAMFAVLVQAWEELPKFDQMVLLYPGYYLHGGRYKDQDILDLIGGNVHAKKGHNTASLRLSWTLNRYSGRHSIGTEPVMLSKRGRDSVTGKDGLEYIYRNTAFGPFLAAKYGNPTIVTKANKHEPQLTLMPLYGRRGIVRLVSYHRQHPGGHVALWDCDHFHQSRDWSTESHMISVEFWETPDSVCPPSTSNGAIRPRFQPLGEVINVNHEPDQPGAVIVARHNIQQVFHEGGRTPKRPKKDHRLRHQKKQKDVIWTMQ